MSQKLMVDDELRHSLLAFTSNWVLPSEEKLVQSAVFEYHSIREGRLPDGVSSTDVKRDVERVLSDCFDEKLIEVMTPSRREFVLEEMEFVLKHIVCNDLAKTLDGTPEEVVPPVGAYVITPKGISVLHYLSECVVGSIYSHSWSIGSTTYELESYGTFGWSFANVRFEDQVAQHRLDPTKPQRLLLFGTNENRTAAELIANGDVEVVGPFYTSWSVLVPCGLLRTTSSRT